MKTRWIGVAAIAIVAVAGPVWAGGAARSMPDERRATTLSASAWASLDKGDSASAIRDAEGAALLRPGDAGIRVLLGRAYFAGGRFRSAETAFGDAMILDSSLVRVAVHRALAQIALGKTGAARASLAMADGQAADADIGLALALLGDADSARARLNHAARTAGADVRARQNLGLAYALEGRWVEAVAIAQQDVPADLMPERLRRWTMIAQLKADPAMQIGAIMNVIPAEDPGQPDALARAAPLPLAAASVVSASADPPVTPNSAAWVPSVTRDDNGAVVMSTAIAPPSLDALVAPRRADLAEQRPSVEAAAKMAVMPIDWAGRALTRKARIVEPLPAKPVPDRRTERSMLVSHRAAQRPGQSDEGGWAVQLGAFSSVRRTEIAWGRLSGKATFLSAYTPTGSGRRWRAAMLYRLSVSGLRSRKDAVNLCVRIRARGASCFVRQGHGDKPMNWAARGQGGLRA